MCRRGVGSNIRNGEFVPTVKIMLFSMCVTGESPIESYLCGNVSDPNPYDNIKCKAKE